MQISLNWRIAWNIDSNLGVVMVDVSIQTWFCCYWRRPGQNEHHWLNASLACQFKYEIVVKFVLELQFKSGGGDDGFPTQV